jgi:hypothetical protein
MIVYFFYLVDDGATSLLIFFKQTMKASVFLLRHLPWFAGWLRLKLEQDSHRTANALVFSHSAYALRNFDRPFVGFCNKFSIWLQYDGLPKEIKLNCLSL